MASELMGKTGLLKEVWSILGKNRVEEYHTH